MECSSLGEGCCCWQPTRYQDLSHIIILSCRGFPGVSEVKNLPAKAGDMGLIPGSGRSPGVGNATSPVFLPGKSYGQRNLVGYSSWGHKKLGMTEQLSMHAHLLTVITSA